MARTKLFRDRGPKPAIPSANLPANRYEFAAKKLRDLLPILPSVVVYDIGTGNGQMRRIEEFGAKWRGFDLVARDGKTQWDLSDPCPVPEKAGAVLLLDVIEHCVNPGLALQHIAAALAPEGRLILTTPNPRWSASRLHTLIYGWPSGFTQLDIDQNHHVFTPWPHHLAKLLADAGLEIEEYVTLEGRSRLFHHRLSFFRVLIELVDRSARGMSYALVVRRVG